MLVAQSLGLEQLLRARYWIKLSESFPNQRVMIAFEECIRLDV